MRVAVIGKGAVGLATYQHLKNKHQVELFGKNKFKNLEKSDEIGRAHV